MENVCDFLHYKEKIKSTLHCEDKEKLKKKLALLQKEYLRTAQRLQRAERLVAARKHVRSKLAEQTQQVHKEPDVSCLPPNVSTLTKDTSNDARDPQNDKDRSATDDCRPIIRFQLPIDASSPSTAEVDQDAACNYRSSPALRLRSRRSRLRLEKRIAESSGSTCNSQECPRLTQEDDTGDTLHGVKIINESEDLILHSQSLLLPHWNQQGEIVDVKKKDELIDETGRSELEISEALKENDRQELSHAEEKLEEQKKDEIIPQTNIEPKQGQIIMEREKGTSLMDSCTMVEGLMFPVEYYVRTTRRMSLSNSQPDMQAVLLSQLSVGRPRRARGARGDCSRIQKANKKTQTESCLDMSDPVAETFMDLGGKTQDSGDRFSSSTVCKSKRGRRKRGRGGRKPSSSRYSPHGYPSTQDLNPSSNHTSSNQSSSSHYDPATLSPVIIPQDDVSFQGSPFIVIDSKHGSTENVYPLFLKTISQTSTPLKSNENLQPILLSNTLSTQSSRFPLPSFLPHTLINNMEKFDLQQDFYLPDDQFASLKLQKLKQVSLGLNAEDFTSMSLTASRRSPVHLPDSISPLPLSNPLTTSINVDLPDDKRHVCLRVQDETTPADSQKDLLEPSRSPEEEANKSPSSANGRLQNVQMQLLMSPSLTHPAEPSAPNSSLSLPTIGFTPLCDMPTAPLTSSPAPPFLTLPSPHSPSTLALSPPVLLPSFSPSVQILTPTRITVEPQRYEPYISCSTWDTLTHKTLTLKTGTPLVDVCCPDVSDGRIHVAAAGKWAVFLWSLTSHTEWTPTHTWNFNEPVINVFPVPGSKGLMCVTLGELEIREVRMLSCLQLADVLLHVGPVDTAVAVPESRVVISSPSSFGSELQVFTLSDDAHRSQKSETLVSAGACVRVLAAVDGLPDALIGSDEAGQLFIWNLTTGQLLRRLLLGDGVVHGACLRGYSANGLLLVLLQHHYLSSVEMDEEKKVLFTLLAINPLSGKSALVSSLYPPKSWFGRLCEADVSQARVVALSQSGCVCVWEFQNTTARAVSCPGPDSGWSLARWGGDMLITAQPSGDVTLHCSS